MIIKGNFLGSASFTMQWVGLGARSVAAQSSVLQIVSLQPVSPNTNNPQVIVAYPLIVSGPKRNAAPVEVITADTLIKQGAPNVVEIIKSPTMAGTNLACTRQELAHA